LLLDRVLVERHRHAAQRLGRGHRPVELGPVVADDRGLVAALETERGEAERDTPGPGEVLVPGVRLPDAEVLLTDGDAGGPALGVGAEELREGIHRSSSSLHTSRCLAAASRNSLTLGGERVGGSVRKTSGCVKTNSRYDEDLRRSASTQRAA